MTFNFNALYNRENWIDLFRTKLLPNDFQTNIENVKESINFKLDRFDKVTFLGESKSLNVAVYEIAHKSEFDPRVSLSKEAFRILANFSKRRALIFFVPENNVDYRLSLITIDLELKGKKIQKLYSNPRRYSFLLGAEAKLGTIHDKLLNSKTIEATKRIENFSDLKERFSVESVSKQFFKEYRELYENIKTTFNKIPVFNIVASKHIDSIFLELFSRKLLGQIVFIYFLQRKKWLGGNPSNKKWDDGKKDFLRWAFNYCEQNNLNFFDSFLESLFYKGFNEKDDSFEINKTYIKVPFLNGGLFEKFYQSDETLILHPPNSLFSNNEETGILDVFDRYNFTIDENTFFEQEVAVDPEMLGKVFENLLPENLRKGKGTYYTPREIVSYMTRESLINFLKTKLQTKDCDEDCLDEKIRRLFDYKDFYISKKESEEYGKEFEKQFYEMLDIVEDVNKYLKDIKVVDPAVGSGAFPMGILLEIVSLREYIEKEFLDNKKISIYELKKETIQNSIYGVDIDPGAVEIAKLRFWLSLVVDAKEPEPLPNLDYKIMQGNSLIETFAGINFSQKKETDEIETEKETIKILHDKQEDLYNCIDIKTKAGLRDEIEKIIIELYHSQVEKQKEDYWIAKEHIKKIASSIRKDEDKRNYILREEKKLHSKFNLDFSKADEILQDFSKKDKIRPFFPWHLYFADVFEKGGFDIVIGNPPYVEHKKLKGLSSQLKKFFLTYSGTADLYVYFYEKGIKILRQNGILIFITSNKFIKTRYGENLRQYFAKHRINEIIDFTDVHVFEALVASCIFSISRSDFTDNKIKIAFANDSLLNFSGVSEFIDNNCFLMSQKNLSEKIWQLENETKLALKEKIEGGSITFKKTRTINIYRGVTTGYNPAFIIDEEKRKNLIIEDKANETIIKPLLQGRNIRKWSFIKSTRSLLFIPWHFPLQDDPSITGASLIAEKEIKNNYRSLYSHFKSFKEELSNRNKDETGIRYEWYALQRCAASYYSEFEKEKIIWGLTADKWAFAYDNEKHYLPSNGYILTSKEIPIKYLLALMNSSLMEFYFKFIGIMTAGGAFTLKHETVAEFPIKLIDQKKNQPFIKLVDQILSLKKSGKYTQKLEDQIDLMVYKLYELSYEEVRIVDPDFAMSKEEYDDYKIE